jgi:hypothetical protein
MIRKALSAAVATLAFVAPVAVAESFELVRSTNYSVFVPEGFDDNDEVTVVLDGFLPSTCYKLDSTDYQVNPETRVVTVSQQLRKYDNTCLEVLVPFTNVVRIPALPHGPFTLSAAEGRVTQLIRIAESTNAGPDDFLYAPIENISIESLPGSSTANFAVLEGRFTNTCMQWDGEPRVIDSGRAIEVLPVMKMEQREDCMDIDMWFKVKVNLPRKTELGRYLVHVRSLDGHSENRMFSVRAPSFP